MRHLKAGRKLGRTSSHRRALMRNMATALFEHKKIHTTEAKAKELRGYAERLITKAKTALAREKQGLLPEGQKIDIHNRRLVGREIQNKAVLQELFDSIAPVVEGRPGGYTRVVKTGIRRGDAARTAIVELVDWANEQDGTIALKGKKKRTQRPAAKPKVQPEVKTEAPKEETIATEAQDQVEETTLQEQETQEEPTAQAEETPLKEDQEPIDSQVTETPEEVNVQETTPEEETQQEEPKAQSEEAKPEEEKKEDDENKKSE